MINATPSIVNKPFVIIDKEQLFSSRNERNFTENAQKYMLCLLGQIVQFFYGLKLILLIQMFLKIAVAILLYTIRASELYTASQLKVANSPLSTFVVSADQSTMVTFVSSNGNYYKNSKSGFQKKGVIICECQSTIIGTPQISSDGTLLSVLYRDGFVRVFKIQDDVYYHLQSINVTRQAKNIVSSSDGTYLVVASGTEIVNTSASYKFNTASNAYVLSAAYSIAEKIDMTYDGKYFIEVNNKITNLYTLTGDSYSKKMVFFPNITSNDANLTIQSLTFSNNPKDGSYPFVVVGKYTLSDLYVKNFWIVAYYLLDKTGQIYKMQTLPATYESPLITFAKGGQYFSTTFQQQIKLLSFQSDGFVMNSQHQQFSYEGTIDKVFISQDGAFIAASGKKDATDTVGIITFFVKCPIKNCLRCWGDQCVACQEGMVLVNQSCIVSKISQYKDILSPISSDQQINMRNTSNIQAAKEDGEGTSLLSQILGPVFLIVLFVGLIGTVYLVVVACQIGRFICEQLSRFFSGFGSHRESSSPAMTKEMEIKDRLHQIYAQDGREFRDSNSPIEVKDKNDQELNEEIQIQ